MKKLRFLIAVLLAVGIVGATDVRADLAVKQGTFTRQVGTGNQVINGLGFMPTSVIFFGTNQVVEGVAADATTFFGFASSPTQERGIGQFSADATIGIGATRIAASSITIVKDVLQTISGEGDLVSFDADGFTVNWSVNDGTQNIIHYFALGGDADSAFVGDFNYPITTGNFAVTGVGFTPKVVLMFGNGKLTAVPSSRNRPFEKAFFGIATGATSRVALATSFRAQPAKANKAIGGFNEARVVEARKNLTATEAESDFVSMDPDGFTINVLTTKSAYKISYLALGGNSDFSVFLGSETQGLSVGSKATTGVGFQPDGMLLMTLAHIGGTSADGKIAFGASDGISEGVAGGATQDNPTTNTKVDQFSVSNKVIRMFTPGVTPVTAAEANLTSFDTDGFTLNWTTADATARKFSYLAFKGAVTVANNPPVLATIGPKTTSENVNLNFGITASDPDLTTPSFTAVNLPAGASLTDNLNGTGAFDWTPSFSQAGVFNVTFIASDGALADSEVVVITVTDVNQAPVLAAIGPQAVAENALLAFGTTASDADGTTPILSATGLPAGVIYTDNLNGTGSFSWTPDFTQAGVFNVTFFASDGVDSDSEIVAITVTNVNRLPVLAAIGAQAVAENVLLSFGTSASDADGTTPTLSATGLPTGASYIDNLNGTASFSWTPDFTQAGVFNVTFFASDGVDSDSEIVAITVTNVNRLPVLAAIGAQVIDENVLLSFGTSASDADGTTPILTATGLPLGASYTDNLNGTGSFSWTPDFTQAGVFNVTFFASDGVATDSEIVAITVTNVNQLPVLTAIGAQAANENVLLAFGTTATDADGTTPTLTATGLPTGASYTDNLNGTGSFSWTPDFTQAGVFNVTFFASDGAGSDSEIVAITVSNVNQAPVLATIGSQAFAENALLAFGTSASDADGTTPTLSATGLPTGASYTDNLNGTGSFSWAPDFTQAGVFNVTFFASDGSDSDSEIVTITVSNVNRDPVLASIGAQFIDEGQDLVFVSTTSDPDGDVPNLVMSNTPPGASYTDNGDGTGSFSWTPDFTQAGVFNVTVDASDGSASDFEVVTITVANVNLAPVLAVIGPQATNENVLLAFGTSASDADATIPTLSATGLPLGASYTDNLNGTGSFSWTPDFTQAGVFNVTFFASDGTASDSEIVAVTVNNVNQLPVLAAIGPQATDENVLLAFATSATDADGTTPALSATGLPTGASYTDNLNGTGSFIWTPDFTQQGVFNVTFFASDGADSDSEIVVITVTNVNQLPVLAAIGPQATNENVLLAFGTSASDADGTTPTLSATGLPIGASYTDNLNGTGSFSWTPDFTQSGVFNVTFFASDGAASDSEIVAVTVSNVNQLPVLAAIGPQATNENVLLAFGTLASDADGATPTLSATGLPTGASYTDNLNGTGSFSWTPNFTQAGVFNVTFFASDGVGSDSEIVVITVTDVNQLPVLASIGSQATAENVLLAFGTSASDADGVTPTLSATGLPTGAIYSDNLNGSGSFSWTPDFLQSGVFNITFFATDGVAIDSEVVAITVTDAGNQLPLLTAIGARATNEGVNLNFGISASDIESTPALSSSTLPGTASFVDNANGTGTFDWTPGPIDAGIYNVTFFATDDSLAIDSELVVITVNEVGNILPVLTAIGPQSTAENVLLSFGVSATDAESIPALTTSALPTGASFTDNLDGTGSLSWTPTFLQAGVFNVTFFATDDSLAVDSEIVAITVTEAGNQFPVLAAIGAQATDENVLLNVAVSAADIESTPTLTTSALPAGASFTDNLNGTGSLSWTPSFLQSGVFNVTFFATDDSLAIDSEVVAITVNEAGNQLPVLAAIGAQSTTENILLNFAISASDIESTPTLTISGLPTGASFTDNLDGTGSLSWTPDFTQAGVFNVTFFATDDSLAIDSEVVALTVIEAGNQTPVLAAIGAQVTAENVNLAFGTSASDVDGTTPILSATGLPAGAIYTDNLNGTGFFSWTPDFTQAGVFSVTFFANDGTASDSEIVSVTVTNVNQPPVLAAIGAQAVDENALLSFGTSASDADGTTPILTATGLPLGASYTDNLNGTGSFSWTPDFTQAGVFSVTFFASDGTDSDSELVVITATNVNQPPVLAAIGAQAVDENALLSFGTSASDADGTTPILTATGLPLGASYTDNLNGTGSFSWTPDFTQAGVFNVTFFASDGTDSDSELVVITATNVNQPPVLAAIGAQAVDENALLSFGTTASDADGTTPILTATGLPLGASYTDNLNGTGSFSWTPDFTQAGVFNVTFFASDGAASDSEIVVITASNVNQAPVLAVIGPQATNENVLLAFGTLASDADGTTPTLSAVGLPVGASYTDNLNGTGSFSWTPDFTQAGVFNVTFFASDGVASDSEIVAITVSNVNQLPVLAAIGLHAVAENALLAFGTTASDADGTTPTLTATGLPLGASYTDNLNGTGSFSWTPDFTQAGVFSVTFFASDGAASDSEIVAITVSNVNQLPVLAAIGSQAVAENVLLSFGTTASDADGTTPILTATGLPLGASYTDNLNGTGSLSWTPDFTQAGVFNVTFFASDGVASDSEIVAVTVTNVNRLPALAAIGAQAVDENALLSFGTSASDADGTTPILTATGLPLGASYTDNLNGTGSFSWTPDFTQAGVFNVTFFASDGAGSDSEIVAITVTNVNRLPVLATIGAQAVDENALLSFGTTASDADGTTPTLTATGLPLGASYTDNLNGTGSFSWTPDFTQAGVFNVTFFASDGTASDSEIVAITVSNVNQLPVLAAIGLQAVAENALLAFGTTGSDADGTTPTLSATGLPTGASYTDNLNGTGSFSWTPDFTQAGVFNVTFFASDGVASDSEVVVITVTNVNRLPVLAAIGAQAVDENALLSFGTTASDADGTTPILTATGLPLGASYTDNLNGTGSFSWAPDFTQAGVFNVTFFASDGAGSDSEIVAITITNVNRLPVLAAIGPQAIDENVLLSFGTSASDADGTTPTLTATGLPLGASYTDNLNGTGSFSWTPDFTQAGVLNVTFFASDGAGSDSEIVAITISNVNQAPVLAAIGSQAVAENVLLSFGTTASDADGTTPTLTATGLPLGASYTDNLNGTGSFSWTPDFFQSGVFNVTLFASDASLAVDSEIVSITVNDAGNQLPLLAAIGAQSVVENAALAVAIAATDIESTPSLTTSALPAGASFTDNLDGTGSLDWTPTFLQSGVFNVTFFATDDSLAVDSELVAITVTEAGNQVPVLAAIGAQSTTENTLLSVAVSATDVESIPSLTTSALPAGASFTDNLDGSGSLSWTPTFLQSGVFNVTFFATDDSLVVDSEVVVITVIEAGNQLPVLAGIGLQSTTESVLLAFGVTATDIESTPTFTTSPLPSGASFTDNLNGTGTFSWTPGFTQAGVFNVTFFASDDSLAVDSEVVVITVIEAGNQNPVLALIGPQATTEGSNLIFGLSASDPDATTPSFSSSVLPNVANLTDNLDGTATFSWTPLFNQAGVASITFFATDGAGGLDSEIVSITVAEFGNHDPILAAIGSQSITEGLNLAFNPIATDADSTLAIMTASTLPVGATYIDNNDGTGSFSWTPTFAQSGSYSVTFFASDGVVTDSEVVSINVFESGNQAPVQVAIGAKSVTEGVALAFATSASDPDGTTPTLNATNLPTGASYTDNADGTGSFVWTPSFSQAGIHNVTFFATDGVLADSEVVQITVLESGNQSPVLVAIGSQGVTEGLNLNFNISSSDPDGTTPAVSASPLPAGASFTDNADGSGTFDWTPSFTDAGIYVVTFSTSDGTAIDSEVVTVTVTEAGNQTPLLATIGSQGVTEGLNLSFATSASDQDATTPALSATGLPTGAVYTDNLDGTGSFAWTPDFVQSGVFAVTFIASDGLASDSEVVTITVVDAGNQLPVLAVIGPQSVTEGINLNLPISATNSDGPIPIFSVSNAPVGAGFIDNGDGTATFDWTPTFTQSGSYLIIFIATDDSLTSDSETVSVTVNESGNQPPVLAVIGAQSVTEGSLLAVNASASDPDLTIPALSVTGLPAGANFTDNTDGTGLLSWTPDFTQAGVFNVTFFANDGALLDSEIVAITVNDAGNQTPVLAVIGAQAGVEGAQSLVNVSASDLDATIPALSASSLPAGAVFTDNLDGTGTLDWTPTFVQSGAFNITFFANDGLATDSEIVTITIADAGNQLPVLAAIGAQIVTENINLTFGTSATDAEGAAPALNATGIPTGASFIDNANGTGTFSWTPDFTQNGNFVVTFFATDDSLAVDSELVTITVNDAGNQTPVLAAIGAQSIGEGALLSFVISASDLDATIPALSALPLPLGAALVDNLDGTGTFSWTPDFTQSGVVNVTFSATDGLASDSEVVTITIVDAGNQLPVLAAIGSQTVTEGINLNVPIGASDAENGILVLTTSSMPSGATFLDNGDGTGVFDWTPDFVQTGIYSVTFFATDDSLAVDSEVVTITVTEAGNQSPVLAAIGPQSGSEGALLTFGSSASDLDGGSPALSANSLPAGATYTDNANGTGTFSWTPTFAQSGSYNVTFFATDGFATDSEVVAITINSAGNQAPVLAAVGAKSVTENVLLNFTVTGSDPDLTTPNLSVSSLPAGASFVDNLDGTATFNWIPNFVQAGVFNVTFFASDGALVDSEVVSITVNEAGNQIPVLATIGAPSTTEGVNLTFGTSATDADGSIPLMSASPLPAGASYTDNSDGTGTFNWTPDFTQSGTFLIIFVASDGAVSDSETVSISVLEAGNQQPVQLAIGAQSALEGANLNFVVISSDADGTFPAMTAAPLQPGASYTDNGDGSATFDWTPNFTQSGTYSVTFFASDGLIADSEIVSITINEAGNQFPVLAAIGSQSVTEGGLLSIPVSATDPDNISPALSVVGLPAGAVFVDNGDGSGSFDWTPTFVQAGSYNVVFRASDGALVDSEIVVVTVNESGNQAPVLAVIGSQNVNEGLQLLFVTAASDPDLTTPTLTTGALPAGASYIDNGDGTGLFDWTPNFTQNGIFNVTFFANDGITSDSEVVTITVNEVGNQSPILAAIGSQLTTEGSLLSVAIGATDPDATIPGLSVTSLPLGATFTDNFDGTGSLGWTPDFTQAGVYSITFKASDGILVDSEVVSITVLEAGNQAPLLSAIGAQATTENINLAFALSASDPDGTTPVLTTSALPSGAAFTDNGNGTASFSWTPDFAQSGSYSIVFRASDGVITDSEIVAITVLEAGNQPPVLIAIGAQAVLEGANLNFGVSASDPDVTTPVLSVTALPSGASFIDNLDGTGVFDWSPTFVQSGTYFVTFIATDGLSSDSEIVTISVNESGNQSPVLATIGSKATLEGINLNFATSATDPDVTTPTLTVSGLPSGASYIDNGDGSGSFDWTPDFTQSGTFALTFFASDGALIDSELVTISVNEAGNQTPVMVAIGAQSVTEGAALSFGISASDPDATTPALTSTALPSGASFVDNGNGTGSFAWSPDFTQSGSFSVTFFASDGILMDSQVVAITVLESGNQTPVLAAIGAKATNEGVLLNFALSASDPDGTTPSFTSSTLPLGASLVDNGNGTASFDWTPEFTQSGAFSITFFAGDGLATDSEVVSIVVNESGNQAPVLATIGAQSVTEGALLSLGISASDADATIPALSTVGLPLGATFIDNLDGTASFDWTPLFTQAGVFNVTFKATDGLVTDSEVVTITVIDAGNQIPVLAAIGPQGANEGNLLTFSVSALDPDSTIPALTAASLPAGANYIDNGNGTASFNWTPDFTQSGSYSVTFFASDGVSQDSEIVVITINELGNQAPILAAIGAQGISEGATLGFAISASDVDLTTPALSTSILPLGASFTDNLDGTGSFDWSPTFIQSGAFAVTFFASDGSLIDSEIVTITVIEAGNQLPVMAAIGSQSIGEGLLLTFGISSSDTDGVAPTLATVGLPAGASFTDNFDGTGSFSWTPDFTQAGVHNVTFFATDDSLAVDSEIVAITVIDAGNQNPVLALIGPQSITEGANLTFGASATDPDGTTPALTASGVPAGASFTDNFDGTATFSWTPSFTQSGSFSVTVFASDGVALDSEIVSVTVNEAGNQLPVLAAIGSQSASEGTLLSFAVTASDLDGTIPALSGIPLPAGAIFTDNLDGTGSFSWTPDFTQAGIYIVTFAASDGAAVDSEVVTITINSAGNQAPVLALIGPQNSNEGVNLSFGLSATDADATIPALAAAGLPAGAIFTDNLDGTGLFDWTPDFTQSGSYIVVFTAADGVAIDSEVVTITINDAGNQSPVLALIGSQSVSEGAALSFAINSNDADGTTPSLNTSALPPGASFVDNGDGTGSFNWTPDFTQAAGYTVTFRASDGVAIDSEVVTITVTEAGNQPPVLAAIGPRTTSEGSALAIPVSASDPDGSTPAMTTSALPTGATFTDNNNGTGSFNWTPDFTQAGVFVVTFFASDGLVIDSEQVTITVISSGNQTPILAAIGAQTTTEGILLSFGSSAIDADGTIPTLTTSALPLGAAYIDNLDGTGFFSWTPDFTQAGLYSIVFRASDGVAVDSEMVSISVGDAGNQAPVLAAIGPRSISESALLSFTISASDPDATTPGLTANPLPAGASFTDNGDGTASFSWTPDFTQAGVYNVTFIASDGILDDVEIVTISVLEAGNQTPTLAAIGAQAIAENSLLSFTVNASDPDGTFPTLTSSALPSGASYIDNNNGTASFNWTPDFTQAGIFSVTFFASDGLLLDSEVVQITVVESGNQTPILVSIGSKATTEGVNLTFGISASDPDATIPALSAASLPVGATFTDNADGTGDFNWTPDFTQSGVYSVTFFANDGFALDSEIVTISVNESGNQIPVLATIGPRTTTENVNLSFGLSAIDADGTTPFFTSTALPGGSVLTDNGDGTANFDWTPGFTQDGVYFVIFMASDGVAIDSETVSITVNEAGNQSPVLSAIGAQNVNEGANLNFAVNASDPDATNPALTTSALPAGATFIDNGDGSGAFDWSPDFTQAGGFAVTFFASDGLLIDSESVTITVNSSGNQTPVLASIGPKGVGEGSLLSFGISATDLDATIPALSASSVPLGASFNDNGDGTGSFSWTPDFTQSGTYNVTFFASDGLVSDSEIVTISVSEGGNQAPVLALIGAKSVTEGAALNFAVSVTDADGTIPPLTTSALPAGASFVDNGDGTGAFSWNPTFIQAGVYSVTFGASDGVLSDSEVVSITVIEAGNQLPILAAIGAQTVAENVALNFAVSATDQESIAALTTSALPSGASFIDNGDGTGAFAWTPTFTQSGVYAITFFATDTSLAIDSEIVTITVTEVGNQLPVLTAIGAQSVSENVALNLAISASDAESIPTLTITALPAGASFIDNADGTGAFSWTPTFVQAGVYSVTFFATDDVLAVDSEVVTITVTESGNQSPVLATIGAKSVSENVALNIALSATDAESTPSLTTSALPAGASFVDNADGTGSFDWTPTFLQSGVYNVTFFATDGSAAIDSELVTITVVEAGNQAPLLAAIGAQSTLENALLAFVVSASDAESIPVMTTSALPAGATFSDNGDGTGSFDWTPSFTQVGVYNINFFATDDSLAASGETVTITVIEVGNQLPLLTLIGAQTVAESVNLNFPISAADQESTPILTTTALPAGASFIDNLNGTGTFDWTPDFTQAGLYSITFFATDDSLAVDSEVVSITVTEAGNAAPPLAVTTLGAQIILDAMQLDWFAITLDTNGLATTVDHYVIYRGTSAYFAPGPADSIGFTTAATVSFTDNNIGGVNVVGDTLTQYFYVIEVVDAFGRHSALSNRVGEFDYQIVVTSTTNFNLIGIPFTNTGITNADQLISAIGSVNVLTVNNFVAASQSFESRFAAGFGVNFAVSVGGVYQVNASVNTVLSIAGAIPAPGAINYPIITTATNDFNFLMIPFERQAEFSVAQDIIDNIPGTLNTVNNFVAGSQSYQSRFSVGFGINFPLQPGKPYQANAAAAGSFPSP